MAFLCALGVSATPTGTGTQEDPYVIADGDVYKVDDPVYASFTAPGDGTLTLSYNLMKDPAFTVVGGDVMPFTWGMGSPSTSTLEVKSGFIMQIKLDGVLKLLFHSQRHLVTL